MPQDISAKLDSQAWLPDVGMGRAVKAYAHPLYFLCLMLMLLSHALAPCSSIIRKLSNDTGRRSPARKHLQGRVISILFNMSHDIWDIQDEVENGQS